MSSRLPAPLLGATLVLVLTTRLAAQTQPRPLPLAAAAVEEPVRPPAWDYTVGAGVAWDDNIDFLVPNGPRGFALVPRGTAARTFRAPHGELRARAAGRWTGYTDHAEFRRYFGELGLDGTYQASPHTTWRASASYELGDTSSSEVLLQQGVLLPRVKTRSLSGLLGLTTGLGARTSLRVGAHYYRTEFEPPGFLDGNSLRGTAGLERRLGPRSTAALEYSVEDVMSDPTGRAYLTHFASAQFSRLVSLRSALTLEAGSSYTPDPARAGLEGKAAFFGGVSLSGRIKRSHLALFVRQEVAPAFGLGTSRLERRAGLGATIPIGRDWELRMSGSHAEPAASGPAGRAGGSTSDTTAALARRFGRSLELSGEAGYRRRAAAGARAGLDGFQAGLFLTLSPRP
jgi:hypothetical protein